MKLEEYFGKNSRALTQLDVFVQIMELYAYEGKGRGCISSENYRAGYVETETKSIGGEVRYANISFVGEACDENIHAVPKVSVDSSEEEREKGDVFCLGLLMQKLRGREIPPLFQAETLLNMIEEGEPRPFLNVKAGAGSSEEESAICSLISCMTDLNAGTRPNMTECLAIAAGTRNGKAIIRLIEKGTFAEKRDIELVLKTPMTKWHPDERYEIGGKSYIPTDPDSIIEIPYRVFDERVINTYIVQEKVGYPERWPVAVLADRLCLGIDFGTWTSSVSFVNADGLTEDLEFDGENHTPTAVLYLERDRCVFGREALAMAKDHPAALVNCFKRRIETNEVFECTAVNGEKVSEHYFGIAERFLSFLYGECRKKFGSEMDTASVTMTIPACYDAGMRTAIKEAAGRAGFVPEPLTEPEAAAVFFGMCNNCSGKIIILDIGGGTTDLCLLTCWQSENSFPEIKVQYIGGDEQLGGVDFTDIVSDKMLGDMLRREYDLDLSTREASGLDSLFYYENRQKLRETAENVKISLSSADETEAVLTLRFPGGNSRRIAFPCRRKRFEALINLKITEIKKQIKNCIFSNGLGPSDVAAVILVGGTSTVPAVRRMVGDLFSGTECRVHYVDYPTVVSRGAAVYSNERCVGENSRQCLKETNYDIGIVNNVPFSRREIFTCLIVAGTPFNEQVLEIKTECRLTQEEKDGNFCRMILYRRPKEYQHVESPLDADGDVIRKIGALYVPKLPENFDKENGTVLFHMIIDPQECITANALFYNYKNNKKGVAEREFAEIGRAAFVPLNGDLDSFI